MLSCSQSLMQSHSSCHHGHLVIFALVHHLEKQQALSSALQSLSHCLTSSCTQRQSHLCLSNMEVLVAVIDDGTVLAAGSDVANTLHEGGSERL